VAGSETNKKIPLIITHSFRIRFKTLGFEYMYLTVNLKLGILSGFEEFENHKIYNFYNFIQLYIGYAYRTGVCFTSRLFHTISSSLKNAAVTTNFWKR
jgi:hypothetical protein